MHRRGALKYPEQSRPWAPAALLGSEGRRPPISAAGEQRLLDETPIEQGFPQEGVGALLRARQMRNELNALQYLVNRRPRFEFLRLSILLKLAF